MSALLSTAHLCNERRHVPVGNKIYIIAALVISLNMLAVVALPGYNEKTRLAPAPPGWLSLAPGRSEERSL